MMELILKGFKDWCIDTAHNEKGERWADVYRKTGPGHNDWEQFGCFESVDEALDCLIEDGLEMTEDQVCDVQQDIETDARMKGGEDDLSFFERIAHMGRAA
jgi:hypothetical protein